MKKLNLLINTFVICRTILPISFLEHGHASNITTHTQQKPIYETEFTTKSVIEFANSKGIDLFSQDKFLSQNQTFAYVCNGTPQTLDDLVETISAHLLYNRTSRVDNLFSNYSLAKDLEATTRRDIYDKLGREYHMHNNKSNFCITPDFTSLNCISVLIFNTICGNQGICFQNGVDEMLYSIIIEYINNNHKEYNITNTIYNEKYQIGLSYITGLMFQNMISNDWQLKDCWTFAQNFERSFSDLMHFFHNVNYDTVTELYNNILELYRKNNTSTIHINSIDMFFTSELKDLLLKRLISLYGFQTEIRYPTYTSKFVHNTQRKLLNLFQEVPCADLTVMQNNFDKMISIQNHCQVFSIFPEKSQHNKVPKFNNIGCIARVVLEDLSPYVIENDLMLKTIRYFSKVKGLACRNAKAKNITLTSMGKKFTADLASFNSQEDSINDTNVVPNEIPETLINIGYETLSALSQKYTLQYDLKRSLDSFKKENDNIDSQHNSRIMQILTKHYQTCIKKYCNFGGLRYMKETEEVSDLLKNIIESIEVVCAKKWRNLDNGEK